MKSRVVTGKLFPDLLESLITHINRVKEDDPIRPIYILTSSNVSINFLRKEVASRLDGFINIRFFTFFDLVKHLSVFDGENRPLLPDFADEVLVAGLLEENEKEVDSFIQIPRGGLIRALLSTFNDLSEAGLDVKLASKILESKEFCGRVKDVLRLFCSFRESVESGWEDHVTLFHKAINNAEKLDRSVYMLAFGLYDFNELQWRLIDKIAKTTDTTLFVPYVNEGSYRFVKGTINRFKEIGFEIVEADAKRVEPKKVELINAPGEEEEVRGVVEKIIRLVLDGSYSFSEFAVLLPQPQGYILTILDALDEAGIPYRAGAVPVLRVYPVGVGIRGLLELLTGEFRRGELIEFLSSSPLKVKAEDSVDAVSEWIRISANEVVYGVADEWIERSAELLDRIKRFQSYSESEILVVEKIHAIIKMIVQARKRFAEAKRWSEFSNIFLDLINELFELSDEEELIGAIRALGVLDRVVSPISSSTYAGTVSRLLSHEVAVASDNVEGITILPLWMVRGAQYSVIFIPGLIEGNIPSGVRQDPLLMDDERAIINTLSKGRVRLREKLERVDEERLIFRLASDSARDILTLSYPRFRDSDGRPVVKSSILRFVESTDNSASIGSVLEEKRLRRLGASEGSRGVISEREFEFLGVVEYIRGDGCLPTGKFFFKGAEMLVRRWSRVRLTPYDGVFEDRTVKEEMRKFLDECTYTFSPTSLQSYVGCPFSYFLSEILGVESVEEPEVVSIAPLSRGRIVHRILAELYSELKRQRLLPFSAEDREKVMDIADSVISTALMEAERNEPVGLKLFWEMEKKIIRRMVELFLENEMENDSSCIPTYFEIPFGYDEESQVEMELGRERVRFKGRIDRIDICPGGFRVIDYKTGRIASGMVGEEKVLDVLQLPVYLLASSSLLGLPVSSGHSEFLSLNPATMSARLMLDGREWGKLEGPLKEKLSVVVRGIEEGLFFSFPFSDYCDICEFRTVCPSGYKDSIDEKLMKDGRARDFLEMVGVVDIEEG